MGMSRIQLWDALGLEVKVVEPMLMDAYRREAEREWRGDGDDAPHGARWATSFHASSFPGDDPLACGRAAIYGLMDLPSEKPREPFLSAWFDVGSNLEHDWVRRLHAEGMLLSKSPAVGDDYQTVFIDREHWLSGAADAIVLPPFWRRGHNVEVKTTSAEKVQAMRDNSERTPYSHSKYVRQLKTYIALAYEQRFAPEVTVCEESWAILREFPMGMKFCPMHHSFDCKPVELKLEPPTDGTLIYSSREDPLTTASYLVEYDPAFIAAGRAKLAEWRDYYLNGLIPAHPLEGQRAKWSVPPCKFCDFKRQCKVDFTKKTARIVDSAWIPVAEKIRDYDYAEARTAVLTRWGAEDPLEQEAFAA